MNSIFLNSFDGKTILISFFLSLSCLQFISMWERAFTMSSDGTGIGSLWMLKFEVFVGFSNYSNPQNYFRSFSILRNLLFMDTDGPSWISWFDVNFRVSCLSWGLLSFFCFFIESSNVAYVRFFDNGPFCKKFRSGACFGYYFFTCFGELVLSSFS